MTTSHQQDVGKALTRLREQRALSQAQLAEAAGVAQSMLSSIERGRRAPRPATRVKLAAALGMSLVDLDAAIGLAPDAAPMALRHPLARRLLGLAAEVDQALSSSPKTRANRS